MVTKITGSMIDASAVAHANMADNSVGHDEMRDDSIGTNELQDSAVTAGKLASTLDLSGKTLTLSAAQRAVDYLEYRDEKASGTAGGGFTSGSWQTRTITTEKADTGNHGSLASNQITLAAGTYECLITAMAGACNAHQARLYNVTDAAETLLGANVWAGTGATEYIPGIVAGRFTIAAQKVFEVQHRCSTTKATDGFGVATSWGTEVYLIAQFWKVG